MPNLDFVISHDIEHTARVRQVSSMFDVPLAERKERRWSASVDFDKLDSWNVGLVVGPSGCGKSQCARALFGELVDPTFEWNAGAVVDDFSDRFSVEQITNVCSAVGFNTIPNWLTPFRYLSNGEQFRVRLARSLLEADDDGPLVIDEFTSVVDRQVAKIGSHAVQKYVRKNDRQFVAVSCHEDIEEWLRPDWVFRPATGEYYAGRWVHRSRPKIDVAIEPVRRETWKMFASFHYMSAKVHPAARMFSLLIDEKPVAITAIMNQPTTGKRRIAKISRTVTLPDWQGLGLSFVLNEALGSVYRQRGVLLHNYPAHPSYVRSHMRSKRWQMRTKPGAILSGPLQTSGCYKSLRRPCAVFRYVGSASTKEKADLLLGPHLWREP